MQGKPLTVVWQGKGPFTRSRLGGSGPTADLCTQTPWVPEDADDEDPPGTDS